MRKKKCVLNGRHKNKRAYASACAVQRTFLYAIADSCACAYDCVVRVSQSLPVSNGDIDIRDNL